LRTPRHGRRSQMTDCPALRRSATRLDRNQAVAFGVKLAESRLRPPELLARARPRCPS
jgi:hypothetical protein